MAESLTPDNLSAIVEGVVAKLREAPPESLARSGEGTEGTAPEGSDGPSDSERKFSFVLVSPPPPSAV